MHEFVVILWLYKSNNVLEIFLHWISPPPPPPKYFSLASPLVKYFVEFHWLQLQSVAISYFQQLLLKVKYLNFWQGLLKVSSYNFFSCAGNAMKFGLLCCRHNKNVHPRLYTGTSKTNIQLTLEL
jgi:hypothetical protein